MDYKIVTYTDKQIKELLFAKTTNSMEHLSWAEEKCLQAGVTKTVYGFPNMEVARIFRSITHRSNLFESLYADPYLKQQDPAHKKFIKTYLKWSSPVVSGLNRFKYQYPSNGSSEAIKDTLNLIRSKYPESRLAMFIGEYEGAVSYAKASGLPLVVIDRYGFDSAGDSSSLNLDSLQQGDFFYISQPSAMDGNIFLGFDKLVSKCESKGIKLLVDLTYVGAVAKKYNIDLTSSAIHTVFFSLSKLGMYYQRIGGCLTQEENGFLYGNMWFKNMLSMAVGTSYMKEYPVYSVASKYAKVQREAVGYLNRNYGLQLKACDVYLLANRLVEDPQNLNISPFFNGLLRNIGRQYSLRMCLTPLLDVGSTIWGFNSWVAGYEN